jgi:hypothetical protein
VGSGNLCAGAEQFQRTHVFRQNGYLLNYQGKELVDNCRCYVLVDDHMFVSLGDPGEPDVSLRYTIYGNTLRFDVLIPDQCSTAKCRDAIAFSVGQYALGTWVRVD